MRPLSRGGRTKTREAPERRCIATGATGPQRGLIRFVVGPEGTIVPDIAGKLPGRGMWVSADRAALSRAVEKQFFSRAARMPVTAPDGLIGEVETALVRRLTGLLSMARKAGEAVAGLEKVKGWLLSGEAALLMQASDGSPREKARLRPPKGQDTYFDVLTARELGLSFGREHVIHAALAAGGLAEKVREDATRLSGVRERDGGRAAGKAKKTHERE